MLFRGTFSLESVHKRPALALLGKNRRLVDGQLEKKEKGKEEKNDCEAVIFPCRATFYHPSQNICPSCYPSEIRLYVMK
jgi:hypothetical protein